MSTESADEVSLPIRALVRYGPSGPDILELSASVDREDEPSDDLRRLLGSILDDRFETVDEPFGSHAGTVYWFGDGVVAHVPEYEATSTGTRGLVATLDHDGGLSTTELLEHVRSLARANGERSATRGS